MSDALALHAAALFAIDPVGLGGVCLRARPGPARERWLLALQALLPRPMRKLPLHVDDHRLMGGLDLTATLAAGRPVQQNGLLAESDGGVLCIAMAEQMSAELAARLACVIDAGSVPHPSLRQAVLPARLGWVVLDEGVDEGDVPGAGRGSPARPQRGASRSADGGLQRESVPEVLSERLALHLRLDERRLGPLRARHPQDALSAGGGFDAAGVSDVGHPPGAGRALEVRRALDALDIVAARERWQAVVVEADVHEQCCAAAQLLGIVSLRAPLLAVRVARAAAALAGRERATVEDAELAFQLVLAPRARCLPRAPQAQPDAAPAAAPPEPPADAAHAAQAESSPPPPVRDEDRSPSSEALEVRPDPGPREPQTGPGLTEPTPLEERVLEAARSVLPPGLLQQLAAAPRTAMPATRGVSGAMAASRRRGRPVGTERGLPVNGARLDLLATLRAAAPWQALRRRDAFGSGTSTSCVDASTGAADVSQTHVLAQAVETARVDAPLRGTCAPAAASAGQTESSPLPGSRLRLHLHRDDLRVRRCRERRETATIFVVDASGSAALHRLAEAKGAVELLLADCYVRRDRVALIAFRGRTAEVLLPPTRSLPRAKRCLAALPGGGGTPLAAGIGAATGLAAQLQRQGASPGVVVLSDGAANVSRDGRPGREAAQADALAAARELGRSGWPAVFIDTAPRPQPASQAVAAALGARYVALPFADAQQLRRAVGMGH